MGRRMGPKKRSLRKDATRQIHGLSSQDVPRRASSRGDAIRPIWLAGVPFPETRTLRNITAHDVIGNRRLLIVSTLTPETTLETLWKRSTSSPAWRIRCSGEAELRWRARRSASG